MNSMKNIYDFVQACGLRKHHLLSSTGLILVAKRRNEKVDDVSGNYLSLYTHYWVQAWISMCNPENGVSPLDISKAGEVIAPASTVYDHPPVLCLPYRLPLQREGVLSGLSALRRCHLLGTYPTTNLYPRRKFFLLPNPDVDPVANATCF